MGFGVVERRMKEFDFVGGGESEGLVMEGEDRGSGEGKGGKRLVFGEMFVVRGEG